MMRLFNEQSVEDIADEVREQRGVTDTYTIAELKSAVHNAIQKYKQNNPTNTVNDGVLTNSYDVPILNYKLYGNSTQETRSGKNLLDTLGNKSAGTSETVRGITFTVLSDGKINVNGTSTARANFFIVDNVNIPIPDGKYKMFGNSANAIVMATINNNGSTIYPQGNGLEITLSNAFLNSLYVSVISADVEVNNETVFALMQLSSNSDTSYEPYGVMPSPDYSSEIKSVGDLVTEGEHAGKYKVPIKVSGKNLFNADGNLNQNTYAANGTTTYSNGIITTTSNFNGRGQGQKISIPAGTQVTFSATVIDLGSSNSAYLNIVQAKNGTFASQHNVGTLQLNARIINTVTIEDDVDEVIFTFINGSASGTGAKYKDVQVEIGSTATSYEPYHEPIIKNIYLDEPLRGIGDVADYIDFSTGKRHNLFGEIVFDGNNNQHWLGAGGNDNYYRFYCDNVPNVENLSGVSQCMSNYFKRSAYISMDTELEAISSSTYDGYIYLMLLKSRLTAVSVSGLQNWLSTHNTEVVYKLATPTEENIELPPLNAFNDTTIIELDTEVQPSKIEANYITKVGV